MTSTATTGSRTVEVILDGAARALARRGVNKLSMSDICEEAGLSRGTLYRYFKSREAVLEALSQHVLLSMRAVLEEAVADRPDPAQRVRVVMDAMMSFDQRLPYTTAIVSTEPGFAMEFFRRSMPTYLKILVDVLGPALAEAPPVAEGVISAKQLAEILNRLVLSAYLLPAPGSDQLASRFSDVWYSLVAAKQGLEAPERRRRAAGGKKGSRASLSPSAVEPSPLATPTSTMAAILDGAARALGRQGVRRLTMSDICREAGVSRGTLYRYFESKDEVLDAVNRRVEAGMRTMFDAAVDADPEPSHRLRVMLRAMIRAPKDHPHLTRLVEREPSSAITFLSRELPTLAEVVAGYLEPGVRDSPPVRDGVVTIVELAEIFQRLISSAILIQTPGSGALDARISDLWDFMVAPSGAEPSRVPSAKAAAKRRRTA